MLHFPSSLMHNTLVEWANFLVRWIHLIAGISWIGNSFYFMWLDSSFEPLTTPRTGVDGELYMVHGGHFYHVEKQKIRPDFIPKTLHWFMWEATFTWLSGFVLLILLYYFTGGIYLIGPGSYLQNPIHAVLTSLGLLAGSWFVYDFFWTSRFAEKYTAWATGISLFAVGALSWSLCKLFTGRGAFIHLGAIFATLMVLNVWIRILPGQRKILADARAGKIPNYNSGEKAKWRSTHNSYMTLPVLFAMISNHFALAYGSSTNWIPLVLLCVLGGLTRHMMLQWNKGKTGLIFLAPITVCVALLIGFTLPRTASTNPTGTIPFTKVHAIINSRCLSCHSQHPTDPLFVAPPNGIIFEDPLMIQKMAPRIRERAWITKTMPLANRSGITEEEREILGRWVDGGADIHD